jgi:hypothetical protein
MGMCGFGDKTLPFFLIGLSEGIVRWRAQVEAEETKF